MLAKIGSVLRDRAVAVSLIAFIASVSAVIGFELSDDVKAALVSIATFIGGYLGGKMAPQPEALQK